VGSPCRGAGRFKRLRKGKSGSRTGFNDLFALFLAPILERADHYRDIDFVEDFLSGAPNRS